MSCPERAGSGSFTLAASNLEEEVARLKKLNIDTSQRTSGEKVKTLMITDPDGHHIAFAETTDQASPDESSRYGLNVAR